MRLTRTHIWCASLSQVECPDDVLLGVSRPRLGVINLIFVRRTRIRVAPGHFWHDGRDYGERFTGSTGSNAGVCSTGSIGDDVGGSGCDSGAIGGGCGGAWAAAGNGEFFGCDKHRVARGIREALGMHSK